MSNPIIMLAVPSAVIASQHSSAADGSAGRAQSTNEELPMGLMQPWGLMLVNLDLVSLDTRFRIGTLVSCSINFGKFCCPFDLMPHGCFMKLLFLGFSPCQYVS